MNRMGDTNMRHGFANELASDIADSLDELRATATAIYDEELREIETAAADERIETVTYDTLNERIVAIQERVDDINEHVYRLDGHIDDLDIHNARLRDENEELETVSGVTGVAQLATDLLFELDGRAADDGAAGALAWVTTALRELSLFNPAPDAATVHPRRTDDPTVLFELAVHDAVTAVAS